MLKRTTPGMLSCTRTIIMLKIVDVEVESLVMLYYVRRHIGITNYFAAHNTGIIII